MHKEKHMHMLHNDMCVYKMKVEIDFLKGKKKTNKLEGAKKRDRMMV